MSRVEIISFAVAALAFGIWLAATLGTIATQQSYFLLAATVFFVIGFASLVIRYAKAVAPEWNDE